MNGKNLEIQGITTSQRAEEFAPSEWFSTIQLVSEQLVLHQGSMRDTFHAAYPSLEDKDEIISLVVHFPEGMTPSERVSVEEYLREICQMVKATTCAYYSYNTESSRLERWTETRTSTAYSESELYAAGFRPRTPVGYPEMSNFLCGPSTEA